MCKYYPCSMCNSFWGVSPDYCTFCKDYAEKETETLNAKNQRSSQ